MSRLNITTPDKHYHQAFELNTGLTQRGDDQDNQYIAVNTDIAAMNNSMYDKYDKYQSYFTVPGLQVG